MRGRLRFLALAALFSLGVASAQTITFWHTYNQDSDENRTLVEKVIPAFEKANPGIKVKAQAIPYPDFRQKLLTSIAGGTVPDVARIDIIWSPEFANLGALEKLDGYPGFATLRGRFSRARCRRTPGGEATTACRLTPTPRSFCITPTR